MAPSPSIPSRVECRWENDSAFQSLEGSLYIDFKAGKLGFTMETNFDNDKWYWQVPLEDVRPLLSMGGHDRAVVLEFKSESAAEWMTAKSILSVERQKGVLRLKPESTNGEEYRFSISDIESLLAEQ